MTVSNQACRTSAIGTGAAQTVSFSFPITLNADVLVYKRTTATGAETPLTENSHYTLTNNGTSGGSVTTLSPYISSDYTIHVIRQTAATQTVDLTAGGAFDAEVQESEFDKLTKLVIEAKDGIARSLRLPETDATDTNNLALPSSVDRASKYLSFDANGVPIAATSVAAGTVSFTAIGTSIAEAANQGAVQVIIGLGSAGLLETDNDGTLAADSDSLIPTQKAVKTYADTKATDAAVVHNTGAENIAGVKTFASSPIVPAPTTEFQAATKGYVDAAGAAAIVQVVSTQSGSVATGSTTIPVDDTIPQNTEGDQYLSRTIVPTSATNKLMIDVSVNVSNSANFDPTTVALFQDDTANALAVVSMASTQDTVNNIAMRFVMVAGTTSSTNFKVRIGGASGSITFNGVSGARLFGGVSASSIVISEIKV